MTPHVTESRTCKTKGDLGRAGKSPKKVRLAEAGDRQDGRNCGVLKNFVPLETVTWTNEGSMQANRIHLHTRFWPNSECEFRHPRVQFEGPLSLKTFVSEHMAAFYGIYSICLDP